MPLRDALEPALAANVAAISFEAANPAHAHEWELFEDFDLPDGKALIPGVIDTLTNHVEHPRLVARRLETFARIAGKENVIGGTDCGFGTAVGAPMVHPKIAWMKRPGRDRTRPGRAARRARAPRRRGGRAARR